MTAHPDATQELALAGVELDKTARLVHHYNAKWWVDPATGAPKERNIGELLMLCVSELAEAMEGHRKSLPDDKLSHRRMLDVELVDCLIRVLDACAGLGVPVGDIFAEKMLYNSTRPDHQLEARLQPGGKKY